MEAEDKYLRKDAKGYSWLFSGLPVMHPSSEMRQPSKDKEINKVPANEVLPLTDACDRPRLHRY